MITIYVAFIEQTLKTMKLSIQRYCLLLGIIVYALIILLTSNPSVYKGLCKGLQYSYSMQT